MPITAFVEWLMGLPRDWVTDTAYRLTANQQATALGNSVLPLQAVEGRLRLASARWPQHSARSCF